MQNTPSYQTYNYADKLESGNRIRIEHLISMSKPEIAGLVSHDLVVLVKQRLESAEKEEAIFVKLQEACREWEEQAAQTQRLDKAIQYVKIPAVKHTSNRWVEDRYHLHQRSNAVYKMHYRVGENTHYDRTLQKSVTTSLELSWGVHLQDPAETRTSERIAGQERKRFGDKAAMEKYLQGRIKAYSHLFTEISPPIPKKYVGRFTVNGQLLPGYTVESEQEKESVLGQLEKAKEQVQEKFRKGNDFNQPPHLSPWGEVKTCEKLFSGIFQVTTEQGGGIMVAKDVAAVLSPLTCKRGENRGGYICFQDKDVVLRELTDKKMLHAEQAVSESVSAPRSTVNR